MAYGKELIIDLYECDATLFNREDLTRFFKELVDDVLHMVRSDLHFWDYKEYEGCEKDYETAPPHLKGTSAIQFITTSNITIHTLDTAKEIYLNIFSCKDFDHTIVSDFVTGFFKSSSHINSFSVHTRGDDSKCPKP